MPSFTDPCAFIGHVSASCIPSVGGSGHTWSCLLNGVLLGTLSTSGIHAVAHAVAYADQNHVHFKYHPANY